jgi:thiol-disulfide isomerase/thioredoxin
MSVHRLLAFTALCLVISAAQAEATLEGMRPGAHVNGPKLDPAELKGRVVLFEYWGVNCPPCLASIPHISELQEKYGRDHFVVIANHCQSADDNKTRSVFNGRGGSDQITVINQGELAGAKVSGIPRCFLFSHEGKLVFDGSPFELDAALESAIKNSPGFLVAGRTYQKTQKQAAALGALKSNMSSTLKSLRTLSKGEDATAKEEANYLLGKVAEFSQQNLSKISKARSEDPLAAQTSLARMVQLLAGDELGEPFETLAKELKSDKVFQGELKAASMLSDIRAAASKIGLDTKPEEAKRNRSAVTQITEAIKTLVKKYPDTKAANQATELSKRWEI